MHCFAKISSHLQRKGHKFLTCYFNFREKTKVNCNQGKEIFEHQTFVNLKFSQELLVPSSLFSALNAYFSIKKIVKYPPPNLIILLFQSGAELEQ